MASVRQRKRSDQNPLLLTDRLKGLALSWSVSTSQQECDRLRLAAKTIDFRIRNHAIGQRRDIYSP